MTEPNTPPKADLKEAGVILNRFWTDLIDLKKGVDKYATIEEIKNKKSMNGANAWMLMCSIMIASIGLNQNSQAVIIGAMLISPLMSPILGIGLGIGINDSQTLRQSLRHFFAAILIAIVTSTIYFWFSPFDEITPEIQARTTPTILDVLIAIFGGIAGIVSIARKDISTTLPGVAIATALMPPLCVTGYGIANGNWTFALSSFYLFFLNTVFVSLATYAIVRYLRFPYRKFVDAKRKQKNQLLIGLFATLILVPSIWIFSNVLRDYNQERHVNQFINEYIGDDRIFLDDYQFINAEPTNKLILKVYGSEIDKSKIPFYNLGLEKNHLHNTEIEIISTSEIKLQKLSELESQVKGIAGMAGAFEALKNEKSTQDEKFDQLRAEFEKYRIDTTSFSGLCRELKVLFPDVQEIMLSRAQVHQSNGSIGELPILLVDWSESTRSKTKEEQSLKIKEFVKIRKNLDTIRVLEY